MELILKNEHCAVTVTDAGALAVGETAVMRPAARRL